MAQDEKRKTKYHVKEYFKSLSVAALVLAFIIGTNAALSALLFQDKLDYWIWLGCPSVVRVLFSESGYPGHGLTESIHHENYFRRLPSTGLGYEDLQKRFGDPDLIEQDTDSGLIMAEYPNFAVYLHGDMNEAPSQWTVTYTVVTAKKYRFTRQRFGVGDSLESVQYDARYYDSIIDKDKLEPGFTWGYIDGSGLTMWTWVEFKCDENGIVEAILLYKPW